VRKIDCLILSTGRAASTSLYHYIDKRASVGLPWNKEPHTLIDVARYPKRSRVLDEIYIADLDRYEALYSDSGLMLDASVGYFFYIRELVETLEKLQQNPRVVFLYREPVSRAASLFNELRKKEFERNGTLEEALSEKKPAGLWWENYYDNVPYFDHFVLMKSYFRDVLPISYAAVAENPARVVDTVMEFLGVDATTEIEYIKYNSSARAGVAMLGKRWPHLRRLLPRPIRQGVASIYAALYRGPASRPSDIQRYLGYSIDQYRLFKEYLTRERLEVNHQN